MIAGLVIQLAEVRRHVAGQIAKLDRELRRLVRQDPTPQRFITLPGVGPVTALAFLSVIDTPERFNMPATSDPTLA